MRLALGPVRLFADRQQSLSRLLKQSEDTVVPLGFRQVQCMGQPLGRGHHEPRGVDEGVEFQQVQPRQVGITQARSDQRSVEQQQRRIGSGDNRLTLCHGARRAMAIAQPATGVAGVDRGKGQGGAAHAPALERKWNGENCPKRLSDGKAAPTSSDRSPSA